MKKLATSWGMRLQLGLAVTAATVISVALFAYSAWRTQSLDYSYLLWNLFLAGLPLGFALRLAHVLTYKLWSAWESILWTLLWLAFLPNSFYMVSDYIHLSEVPANDILYVAVMFTSFIFFGLILGYSSLYVVHHQLRRRLSSWAAASWVIMILLICSFGIYIGRDLRWNSWDIITNPGGLLFDLSDRLLRPEAYPDMLLTTASFTLLLCGLYAVIWKLARLLRQVAAHEALLYVRQQQRADLRR